MTTVAPRPPASADSATPMQRDEVRTIFEKGARGRRAFQCPPAGVPERDPHELLPESLRRSEGFRDFAGVFAPAAGHIGFAAALAADNRRNRLDDLPRLDF